jgi:flagellar biosynthesis GTPase FlhF
METVGHEPVMETETVEPVAETVEPVAETTEPAPIAATIPADWSFIAFDELTSLEPDVADHDLIDHAVGTAGVTTWTNEIVHGESASALSAGLTGESEVAEEAPAGLDPEVEARIAALEEHLLDTGFSAARAGELIATASENLDSTSDRAAFEDALHAAIVSALPAPRSLPVGAIAVVGAGGSGKTRCVAALASAHARVVVVPVNVAKLGETDGELAGLLRGEAVTDLGSGSSDELGEAVGTARDGGLVIIDTEAVAPNDTPAMDRLAGSLGELELDGIYLAVPATLSPRAAAKLAQGFSSLAPTGIIATHVDEGDQLGMVAELAMSTGTPIGYAHAGTDIQTAILSTHREQLAARLLA